MLQSPHTLVLHVKKSVYRSCLVVRASWEAVVILPGLMSFHRCGEVMSSGVSSSFLFFPEVCPTCRLRNITSLIEE